MEGITKRLATLGGVGLAVGLLGVAFASDTSFAAPSGGGPQQVQVVNTTAQPVPTVAQGTTAISGSVAITGTASVSLSGTPSVTVENTLPIPVVVSSESPVRVEIDRGTPFNWIVQWTSPVGTSGMNQLVYTVPAGKRLRIDQMSIQAFGGSNKPVRLHIYGANLQHVLVVPQMDPSETFGEAILFQAVNLEFTAGQIWVTDSRRDYGNGYDLFNTLNISGHLVDD